MRRSSVYFFVDQLTLFVTRLSSHQCDGVVALFRAQRYGLGVSLDDDFDKIFESPLFLLPTK